MALATTLTTIIRQSKAQDRQRLRHQICCYSFGDIKQLRLTVHLINTRWSLPPLESTFISQNFENYNNNNTNNNNNNNNNNKNNNNNPLRGLFVYIYISSVFTCQETSGRLETQETVSEISDLPHL